MATPQIEILDKPDDGFIFRRHGKFAIVLAAFVALPLVSYQVVRKVFIGAVPEAQELSFYITGSSGDLRPLCFSRLSEGVGSYLAGGVPRRQAYKVYQIDNLDLIRCPITPRRPRLFRHGYLERCLNPDYTRGSGTLPSFQAAGTATIDSESGAGRDIHETFKTDVHDFYNEIHSGVLFTMAEQQPTLSSLAAKISELSYTLTRSLRENNIAEVSFAADSPERYATSSSEIFVQRQILQDTLKDMLYLVQGPSESIFNYAHSVLPDAAALNTLNYFNFWEAVPLEGSASYAEIAERVSLPEDVAYRLLQHGTTLRLFEETEPGKRASRIKHTARSAVLARSPGLRGLIFTTLDISGLPLMALPDALNKYSSGKPALTQDTSETAFALVHDNEKLGKYANAWDKLENDGQGEQKGWRQRIFVEFMAYIKEIFHLEDVLADSVDWSAAGKATVVDIGGSGGHDAFQLARKFPDLSVIVQDLPQVGPVFKKSLPADLESRVSFVSHSMFDPQPIQADIYILKMIFHDWPDNECIKILRSLVPALRPGARIILIEYVGAQSEDAEPSFSRSIKGYGTATDLRIMALFNAAERPVEEWSRILKAADERFQVSKVTANSGTGFFATIEATWRG